MLPSRFIRVISTRSAQGRCDTIDPGMIRRIDYRLAINAFIFTALWFLIGAVVMWSPLPGALGIGGEMFAAWLILFFLALALAGSLLTIASLNGVFPPRAPSPPTGPARATLPPRRAQTTMWAPGAPSAPSSPGHPRHDG
jgi:hypothetical protein